MLLNKHVEKMNLSLMNSGLKKEKHLTKSNIGKKGLQMQNISYYLIEGISNLLPKGGK
jgi:hypothetical protein